jgi:hypothetical protein
LYPYLIDIKKPLPYNRGFLVLGTFGNIRESNFLNYLAAWETRVLVPHIPLMLDPPFKISN